MRAAEAGRVDEVRRLLQNGAGVNEKIDDLGGLNALMLAARRGHLEVVKVLLKAGADPNAFGATDYGKTPLASAITTGKRNVNIVRLLLNAGADPNKPRLWLGDDCVSLVKWLDDELKIAPTRIAAQMKRLIVRAGGRKYATKSNSEGCKP